MNNILTFLLLIALVVPVLSQVRDPGFPLPEGSNYQLSLGSTFSASGGDNSPVGPLRDRKRLVSGLAEALEVVRSQYAGSPSPEDLVKSSISGSLEALDPHSNYFDSKEFADFIAEQDSEYSGIGVTIASFFENGQFDSYALATQPNSPARAAGIEFGDKIIAVNETDVTGLESDLVRDIIRGSDGSSVELTIEKNLSRKVQKVRLRRKRLEQPSIPLHFMLNNGVGYVAMTEGFNYSTSAELKASMAALKRQGMTSLILDLRGNPGGLLDQAVGVAEQFLPAGSVVVSQRGRRAYDNRVWRSKLRSPETMPVILLVNRDTASASEIVAGALQDHDRALIIGERTFGKGLVQNVVDLPSGGALTLTGARYFTPSGRCIQRDYASVGSYEYFNDRNASSAVASSVVMKTDHDRPVFAGKGIEPDENISNKPLSRSERELIEQTFFFVRDYLRAKGVADFQKTGYFRLASDAASRSRLLEEFSRFAKVSGISVDDSNAIGDHLVYYLSLAASAENAEQVLLASDQVVIKAVENLPRARQMAREFDAAPPTQRDVFIEPGKFKAKQPAGSHRRRVENRRN